MMDKHISLTALLDEALPKRGPANCLCGRFAKFVSERHYFDGNFDCITMTVKCKRCGYVDIECV